MKRALSMLVAIAMILSMVPSVFAASETATVLTDVSEIAVSLNEENGYYAEYSWTPAEEGELSLYQYTDLPIEMILTQGENSATSYSEVDGEANYSFAVSLAVVAGEEVTIEVINSNAETQEFTAYGSFVGLPGKSQDNPISLNEPESTVTNTGTLWYSGFFSGTTMTITGEGDFTVNYNGVDTAAVNGAVSMEVTAMNPRMPVVFSLTGEGEYRISFVYPVGTQMNPEVLFRPAYIAVNLEEGNDQGYYYTWTANAAGTLVITCPTVEGVEYDVTMTNMSTYVQATLQESTDGTVAVDVSAGDEVQIVVATLPDENWAYPALSTALTGEFVYPVGSQSNPEIIFRPAYIAVNIEAGNNQGYFYKWTSNADGELKLTCPAVEGVEYDVNMTNMSTYAQAWLVDSTDGTITLAVSAGDEVIIQVAAIPDANWNIPALSTALTGEFIYPIGTQMNPEIIFRPAYIPVNIEAGNNQGYFYKWTANADGELKLTCPVVEGVEYDVNMTNMSTYAQAWLVDSTDGTITLAVKAGDEVVIQVAAIPDASWNIPALSTALTGEFIYPIGTQMNPEILFRPNYIAVNIAEGNNQGYFYKWTANADGELKLTCPVVEGVEYDVNMTNMSTYAQAWLVDSTDGTITLAVSAGDEVVIQVAAIPDASWNIPALSTALTGEFIFPLGSMMNPEVLTELNWYYGNVSQAEGDTDGYYYTWTAPAEGVATFYFGFNEGLENYVLDIIVTNQNTYAQKSLLNDGVDNYGMELQVSVAAGDELTIQIVAIEDAEGNYAPAATMTWCGNFAYPAGSEQNPIIIEWNWDDAYTNATASVTVAAGQTVYFNGQEGMILTVDGVETEQNMGVFSIANSGDAEATYALAMATPVGAYNNPENIELPFEDTNSLAADASYFYIWTATENGTVTLTVTDGANITVDKLTYVEDSEWPISEQFALAEPEIDENWNYIGWIVQDQLVIDVVAGQQLKIQVNGLTDWSSWTVPAVDYTLNASFEAEEPAAITAQPQAVTANSGDTVQFKVETTGEVVSYKWEYRKIYKWFATEMEGYNTDTLTVPVTGARNGYDYRCTITFADGTVLVTEPAELTVNSTIVITANPNDQAVALGYKGQFTAAAEGDGIQYAWQYSRNGETWAYTQMEGYTKPTVLIETTAARDGYMYRCEIKDATGAVAYTEVATLTVLHYTAQPQDVRAEAGNNVTFSVETNAAVVRYEWQYSKDGVKWTNTAMTGYNTATLTVAATAARDGYQYRCVITGAKDSKAYSKAATLYIGAPAVITAQPENATAEAGATVTFSVEATNVLTYQWQYTKDGTNWYTTSMTGATTDTLEVAVTASRNGYQYRCQITGTDGEVIYTNAATLTVG